MHDLVISGGWVLDGTGGPAFPADVGVVGDRIVAVDAGLAGRRTLDASGHYVAPGFVDMHSHSDLQLLADPEAAAKVMQGVVTEVIGQDGLSYAPVSDETIGPIRRQTAAWNGDPPDVTFEWRTVGGYLERLRRDPASLNVGFLVPHGSVRMLVMGGSAQRANQDQLERMRAEVRSGLAEGALGLSTGLTYTPAMHADTEELVALCEELVPFGGYFSPHTRSYGHAVMDAYREMIDVGLRSGAPLHLTHCQVSFPGNEGRAGELLELVAEVDPRRLEITADSYCYVPGSTYLAAFLPAWAWAEGTDGVVSHLEDPVAAERIRMELEEQGTAGFHGALMDWSAIQVSSVHSDANQKWSGMRIDAIAAEMRLTGWEAARSLLVDERLEVNVLTHVGHENNVRMIMQQPWHMGGTDGLMGGNKPHPRAWGTFARYLARYTRELGLFSWPEIVRKLAALPNLRLKQLDRGLIRPGMAADLVVFDPDAVSDTASFDDPRRHPEGIPHVVVNGSVVKDSGVHTGLRPGRVLRLPAART